uniref:Cap-specific mRNA (nucleoside-2'-O-)-methyltransferase 2 (inferred by orthology to a human protein) n=1 Tax=Nippostrongylus brasiliensis TaxID=27835 RepID=A0A0N4YT42_NIPBR
LSQIAHTVFRLNPHHEGTSSCDKLLEDELIVRAPKRWHLGIDDSGDITKDDPAGQEVTTLPLLTAEFNTALRLLKDKGSLIIKVYTLYTQQTRALLSDVLRRFDDVYMFKPMSSKGGNNEAEIGSFRNTVLREFFRRTHAERLAFPLRKSHLTQRRIDRPWSTLVEQNYIEILKQINDSESAVQFLKEFHQKDVMTEHERLEEIEVEFDEDELKFVARSTLEGQQNKSIVRGPVVKTVLHSLFVPPGLLRSLHLWIPEAVIDLCGYTPSIPAGKISYLNSIKFNGEIEVDASKLCGQVEWCTLLVSVFEKIKEGIVAQLRLIWSRSSTPLVLSRFSASIIILLSTMFFRFRLEGGHVIAVFSLPHYAEDLPRGMGSFVHKLLELADDPGIQRAVPISMLAMFHPYILELNRVQWRKIFDVQQLTAADVENSEP